MTRIEFSQMLVEAKENSGMTTTELSFTMKLLHGDLRRIERGLNSYNMEKALCYLQNISHRMVWTSVKTSYAILTYESLVAMIVNLRKKQSLSQRKLAELANCSRVTIANIETQTNIVSIDLLLKIVDALNIDIQIKPNTNGK